MSDPLSLLMVHADDRRPVETGLEDTRAGDAPAPTEEEPESLWAAGGDPQSLPQQRWGVIAPRGPDGDRLLAIIEPLMALRAEEQGAEVVVRRAPAGLDLERSMRWKDRVFMPEGRTRETPRYQLILGDLHQISRAVQQTQGSDGFVGRLAFDDDAGYAAYVEKAVRAARTPTAAREGPLLFHTVHDGTEATRTGHAHLARPAMAASQRMWDYNQLPASRIIDEDEAEPSPDAFLAAARTDAPAAMLSVSHGLGAPKDGWRSVDDMRARQGALSFGGAGALAGADLATVPFLPGGLWFMVACFGAGTPDHSSYQPWLEQLSRLGEAAVPLAALQASLPAAGADPFVAAMPKAALANPDGPLAVIGHVDLAWSYAFTDVRGTLDRSRPFANLLADALRGDRLGVAFSNLFNLFSSVSTELTNMYQSEAGGRPVDPADRAHKWMLRQDLADYVLLGDPAARLPFAHTAVARPAPPTPASAPSTSTGDALPAPLPRLERAILAALSGEESLRRAARGCEVDRDLFERLMDIYRQAGQAALRAWRP